MTLKFNFLSNDHLGALGKENYNNEFINKKGKSLTAIFFRHKSVLTHYG